MSINQNNFPDVTPDFRIKGLCGIHNKVARDSELPLQMGLEYQPGMLPQSVELNTLPALLGDTQFCSE